MIVRLALIEGKEQGPNHEITNLPDICSSSYPIFAITI